MSTLRFDGKVVIVTGGAGAMGSAYCRLFAERGAFIVVNDISCSVDGTPTSSTSPSAIRRPAAASGASAAQQPSTTVQALVDELNRIGAVTGARAVANYDDVQEGEKIVQCAVDNFGRIDVVVNNAGVLRDKTFASMSQSDWDTVLAIHLGGAYRVTKAAWPHMIKQGYGRIINITSTSGLYGNYGQSNYGAAKLALVGLSASLAQEGAKHGIKVNCVAPIGVSRMTANIIPQDLHSLFTPAAAAPIVVCLAHDSCEDTGAVFEAGGGWVARLRWQRSAGVKLSAPTPLEHTSPAAAAALTALPVPGAPLPCSPEALAAAWPTLNDFDATHEVPADYPVDSKSGIVHAMTRQPTQLKGGLAGGAAGGAAGAGYGAGGAAAQRAAVGVGEQQKQMQQTQLQRLVDGPAPIPQHHALTGAGKVTNYVVQTPPLTATPPNTPTDPTSTPTAAQRRAAGATAAAAEATAARSSSAPASAAGATGAAGAAGGAQKYEFEAERIMDLLKEFMDKTIVAKTKGVFVFDVTNGAKKNKKWTLDLKHGDGALYEGLPKAPATKADVTLSISDDDFKKLVYNEAQPQKLFLTGRLKVKGNLALALKFESVLRSMEEKARAKL